jgi:hypothetical protein
MIAAPFSFWQTHFAAHLFDLPKVVPTLDLPQTDV